MLKLNLLELYYLKVEKDQIYSHFIIWLTFENKEGNTYSSQH